jgi:putative methionine-R-sulfoxide reductase with GAF domain
VLPVKIYRSAAEVLSEIEYALSQTRYSPRAVSPLGLAVSALQEGRHYFSATIYFLEANRLLLQAWGGNPGPPQEIRVGDGIVGRVAQTGKVHLALDVSRDSDYRRYFAETCSEIAQPIRTPGRTLGVLNVESAQQNALAFEDQILLKEVASRLGIFLVTRGKYLSHRWRVAETASGTAPESHMSALPDAILGQSSARGAVAGRTTAK